MSKEEILKIINDMDCDETFKILIEEGPSKDHMGNKIDHTRKYTISFSKIILANYPGGENE